MADTWFSCWGLLGVNYWNIDGLRQAQTDKVLFYYELFRFEIYSIIGLRQAQIDEGYLLGFATF